ncbi:GntR family transcriptional regulator [Devosia ginsengisoli]|uniref:GntR family transcriptional regulator n=1 Tax=Devosia ginsengisoli TaxID=400770 RepID=UPI0026F2735F|nr:GntR family transcriptional regulator [Devosia ginsengisoli]MCR6670748.1 GntR family transcriptional regulator [Devosia ginsengisoli]
MNDNLLKQAGAPILHRKKADLVYEYLREQIINGSYAPGQRMTLQDLSNELGLSHMPVREALLRLERENLLASEPHKGMRVVRPSLKAAKELFEIRCELEGLAAFRACRAHEVDLAADLHAINADFSEAFVNQDFSAMGSANWTFHRRILQAAASEQLSRVLEDVWTGSARYRLGYQLIPGRAEHTISEHNAIIAAIESEDAQGAREAARAHIEKAGAELAITVSAEDEA